MTQTGAMQPYSLTVEKFIDHAAKWHPTSFVATAGENGISRVGYAELRSRARRLSQALLRRGVGRGDVIATLGWNTQGHLETWYGATGIGAMCHTLNPRLATAQLMDMVRMSRPKIIFFGAGLGPLALSIADGIRELVALDDAADKDWLALEQLIAEAQEEADWSGVSEDDAAGLCFTSGTTGPPKGVVYTHRSNYLHTQRLLQADALGLVEQDRVLAVVPMFHANGWGLPYAAPAVGADLLLPGRRLDGASLAQMIMTQGATIAAGVPTIWLDLLDHVRKTGDFLPSLRRIYLGGAPLPLDAQRRLEDGLGVSVHTTWGMTELSPLGTISTNGVDGTPPGTSGRPPVGVDMRLTDDQGLPLTSQRVQAGRLQVRGCSVIQRYFGETADATDAEGWFDTGDLACIEADGSLRITGRAKDLIKSGGEWINPAEIEDVVGAMPGVVLAAVIGREDARWGERPLLIVKVEAGKTIDAQDAARALDGRVAKWWIPDAVVCVDDMPLAATGKIDKTRLRMAYGRSEQPTGQPAE